MSPSWMRDNILCTMRHVRLWRSTALGAAYQGSLNSRPIMNRGLRLCIYSDRGWRQSHPHYLSTGTVFFLMRSCWTRPYRLPMKLRSKHATASSWRNCAMLPGTSHKTCLLLHPSLPWRRVTSCPMARSSVLARTNSAAPCALLAFLSGRGT